MNYFLFSEIAPPGDFLSFLIWGIGILIAVIVAMWRLYVSAMNKIENNAKIQLEELKKMMEIRVDEKQELINKLLDEVKRLQGDNIKIMSEIKPSLDAANTISESVLKFLRNGNAKY